MINKNKRLGQICADHRKRIGYTQQQIADELGYSVYNISAFENGRNDSAKILFWYLEHGLEVERNG